MLPTKNESKSDLTEEQSIDSNKTPLLRNVLNLAKTPQDINSIGVLPVRSKSWDKCSNSVSDLINYNQIRILHLKLASIIEKNNN